MIVLFLTLAAPVTAANILIVAGTDGIAQTSAAHLNTDLSGSNTVTIVNTGVPASLAGYTQIYDVRYNNLPAFTSAEMDEYIAWLNAAPGNTLFLMGENTAFNVRNGPINQFIGLAGGGTIAVPATMSSVNETVHEPFNAPNSIDYVTFAAAGLVTTSGNGTFATTEKGGGSGGSIYFTQNTLANASTGALVVVYDVNFIYDPQTRVTTRNETPFRLNMEHFVATAAAPTVKNVVPSSGPLAGGTTVSISGSAFAGATAVNFGGTAAQSYTVINATSITAVSPAGTGTVDITVTTSGGTSATGTADRFTYAPVPTVTGISPSTGPAAGGTTVSITGTAFTGATAVNFGGTAAQSYTVIDATSITAVSPAGTGTVDITVTTPGGTSVTGTADQFTYPAPATYVPTPVATPDTGNDDDITTAAPTVTQTSQPGANLTENVTVNVGGSSAISRAVVTGTGITNLILTGTEKSRPDNGPYPPGTVYQYIDLIPARYGTIAGAEILFSVPQEWLSVHGIAPDTIILYHLTGTGWVALPTRILATKDGTVYFSAASPGFSLFAIAGVTGSPAATPALASSVTITAAETARVAAPVETPVTRFPVAHQTTAAPAPVPEPAASSGFPFTIPVLAVTGCVGLIGGGALVRRWWIRRQNPALFREYD
jgi:PGF-pre-PGF domain-containing protein